MLRDVMCRAATTARRPWKTGSLWLLLVLVIGVSPASGFQKLKPGGQAVSFELRDLQGESVDLSALWKSTTIITFLRDTTGYTMRVLADLSHLKSELSADSVAFWVVAESKRDLRLAFHLPRPLQDCLLFDTAQAAHEAFGLVVLPATAVFSKSGELLAYFPLWRQSLKSEIRRGLAGGANELSRQDVWKSESGRGSVMREARAAVRAGHLDSAVMFLEERIASDALWLDGVLMIGDIELARMDYARAEAVFEDARLNFPPSPRLYLRLAKSHVGLGHLDSALSLINTGRMLAGSPEQFIQLEGEIHMARGHFKLASQRFREAIESLMVD